MFSQQLLAPSLVIQSLRKTFSPRVSAALVFANTRQSRFVYEKLLEKQEWADRDPNKKSFWLCLCFQSPKFPDPEQQLSRILQSTSFSKYVNIHACPLFSSNRERSLFFFWQRQNPKLFFFSSNIPSNFIIKNINYFSGLNICWIACSTAICQTFYFRCSTRLQVTEGKWFSDCEQISEGAASRTKRNVPWNVDKYLPRGLFPQGKRASLAEGEKLARSRADDVFIIL